jgi:hypothetical protein
LSKFIPQYFFYQLIRSTGLSIAILVVWVLIFSVAPGAAQQGGQVQELTGKIEPGEIIIYNLPSLFRGQKLYVHASATSGNLDPIVFLTDTDFDPNALEADIESAMDQAAQEGFDPFEVLDEVRDQFAIAWDDDSGGGLTAALAFTIPEDGEYRLIIGGASSAAGIPSHGEYLMLVGLNTPQVLEGEGEPNGDTVAILNANATPPNIGVQEVVGTLSPEKPSTFVELSSFKENDTLYVNLQATSGDLAPTLVLANFTNKPIRSSNLDGNNRQATLEYTFPVESNNYVLRIGSCCEESELTFGDYRLLLGVNAPEVLSGQAQPQGRLVARDPIPVGAGLILEQIIDVDQQSEFFTVVGSYQLEWTDPALAFDPESCQCEFKVFNDYNIDQFLAEIDNRWPDFTFRNQQGPRWIQNQSIVQFHDGHVTYSERFTTDFQVDFDFRQFPFDSQQFVISIDSIFPEELFQFFNLEEISAVSSTTGEDEFILQDLTIEISSTPTSKGIVSSYIFSFEAPRHLSYYIFRIFVPILLIILISWVTFFLKNYTHRIEVASANLLLFIAFSFSLADNYPRLGYLTFLDAVMAIMFIINALVIVYNVWLRRLEMNDKVDMVERIDDILDWTYPLIYVVLFLGLAIWFF